VLNVTYIPLPLRLLMKAMLLQCLMAALLQQAAACAPTQHLLLLLDTAPGTSFHNCGTTRVPKGLPM
jgi:hypothetical protein